MNRKAQRARQQTCVIRQAFAAKPQHKHKTRGGDAAYTSPTFVNQFATPTFAQELRRNVSGGIIRADDKPIRFTHNGPNRANKSTIGNVKQVGTDLFLTPGKSYK